MKSRVPTLIAVTFSFLFSLSGCITPEVTTNFIASKKLYSLRNLDVAIMPFLAQGLSESEIEDVSEDIIDDLSDCSLFSKIVLPTDPEIAQRRIEELRGNSLAFYIPTYILSKGIEKDLLAKWELSWDGYLKSKKIDTSILKEICSKMGVTSVLQFAVTDVRQTRASHRKVIAETEVEVWYTLFLNDGEILLVGKSIASQANAWSGQMSPRPIEAVEPAIDDILNKFLFSEIY